MAPKLSSGMTLKRIHREIADVKKEDLGGITITPSADNLFLWSAAIPGQEGSPYEGGSFHIEINIPADYPFSAPKVTFLTRIYHMNISDRGSVCIDILKQNWSPALSIFKVILSLSSLLTDPNPQDPLVPSIATEYVRNRTQHDKTAKHWTELYARPGAPAPPAPSPPPSISLTPELFFNMPLFAPRFLQAQARRTNASSPSTRTASAAASTPSPIEIQDSDGEDSSRASASTTNQASTTGKRKREAQDTSRNPKRGRASDPGTGSSSRGDVIIIED